MNTDEHRFVKIPVVAIVVSLLMTGQVLAQACGGYEVAAIIQAPKCPPFGFPPTSGRAISESIEGGLPNVVGHYQSCSIGPDRAFLWIGNENKFITLPMPPGTIRSWAFDITPDGTKIAGSFDLSGDGLGNLGYLYDHETGTFTNLSTLPDGNWSEALAINGNGLATGFWGNNNTGPWQAFIWEDGMMNDLGPSIGGANNRGLDINDIGAITGWWQRKNNGDRLAFVWQDRVMTNLGPIPGGFTSEGHAINSRGDVTGWGKVQDFPMVAHAFVWNDGAMVDIDTLPGFESSTARGINDAMQVVGAAENPGKRAFLWEDGVMMALNDLVPPDLGLDIKVASAINSVGQIIGYGEDSKSDVVSFVLRPIESPMGDLDGDCQVGVSDLLILLAAWGPCLDCDGCAADLDQNCAVGVSDLLILLANWG